jgi:hypothetical protein
MLLSQSPTHYDSTKHKDTALAATNEWDLSPGFLPLTSFVRGNKTLPYFAQFNITLHEAGSNVCKISVVTVSSRVRDGKEPGVHGGWAWHNVHVSPLPSEETNVLDRIDKQLRLVRAGDTNSLPPTDDTKSVHRYMLNSLMELRPDTKTNAPQASEGVASPPQQSGGK